MTWARLTLPMRFLAAIAALALIGALMTGSFARAVKPAEQAGPPVIRMATVLGDPPPSSTHVTVRLAEGPDTGQTARLPFLNPYVPLPADIVNVAYITGSGGAMSGIVVGGRSGQSGNRVLNGELQVINPTGSDPPAGWYKHRAAGTTAAVHGRVGEPHNKPFLVIADLADAGSDTYAYTAAIPVTPGQTWRLSTVGIVNDVTPSIVVSLLALWFTDENALFPNTIAADTLVDTAGFNTPFANFDLDSGGIAVPAKAKFMRVAIRVVLTAGVDAGYGLYIFYAQAYPE